MKHVFFSVALIMAISCYSAKAQVNIGSTNPPDASAALQVSSTIKGFLLPKVSLNNTTTFGLDGNSNTPGLQVFNTNGDISSVTAQYPALASGLYTWDGTGWVASMNPKVFITTGSLFPVVQATATSTWSGPMPMIPSLINNIFCTFSNNNTVTFLKSGKYRLTLTGIVSPQGTGNGQDMLGYFGININGAIAALQMGSTVISGITIPNTSILPSYQTTASIVYNFNNGDNISLSGICQGGSNLLPVYFSILDFAIEKIQ